MMDLTKVHWPSPRAIFIAGLLFAAWAVSLYFNGYYDIRYAATTILLLAVAALTLLRNPPSLHVPQGRAPLFIFAFWLLTTLSLSLSTVPFSSLITWLVFLALPLCFFIFIVASDGRQLLRLVIPLLFIGICGLAVWAILQVSVFRQFYGPRAHDPLADANNLATLLNLGLLPALAWALNNTQDRRHRLMALAVSCLLFAGLLATQSRGGFLCFVSGAFLIILAMRVQIRMQWRRTLALFLISMFLFIAMQFLSGSHLTQRLIALTKPSLDVDLTARLAIWRATWTMIARHPWFGTGFGTFYLYYPAVRPPLTDNSTGFWAHDDVLQFAAEMGLFAPLLFYSAVLAIALRTRNALRGNKLPTADRARLAGLAAALLAIFLHSHIEFDLYVPPILIVAGVWLAAWHYLTAEALNKPDPLYLPTKVQSRVFKAGLVITVILLSLVTLSCASGQYYLGRAQAFIVRGNIVLFLNNIQRAERYAPASFIDPKVQLAGLYIDLLTRPDRDFPISARRKMFSDAQNLLNEAQMQNPAWSEIDRKRAKLFMAAGAALQPNNIDLALAAWETDVQKNPMDFRGRQEWAETLLARGDALDAANILRMGLEYPHSSDVTAQYGDTLKKISVLANLQQQYRAKAKSP